MVKGIRLAALFVLCLADFGLYSSAQDTINLTLEEAVRRAVDNSTAMRMARARLDRAGGRAAEARSALLPTLRLVGSYIRVEEPPERQFFLFPLSFTFSRNNLYLAALSLNQTIYQGGVLRAAIRSAENVRSATEHDLEAEENNLTFEAKRLFYTALLAGEILDVQRESLVFLEDQLERARQQFRAGTLSEFDLLRAEVDLSNQRPQVIAAENRARQAQDALKQLIGLALDQPISLAGRLEFRPLDITLEEARSAAMRCRAELRAQQDLERAAAESVRAARGAYLPSLSLFVHALGTKPEFFSSLSDAFKFDLIGGFQLTLPIFDRAIGARVAQARADLDIAAARREATRREIELEVGRLHDEMRGARALFAAASDALRQAERALRIAEVRFREGLGTSLELSQARLALSQARLNRIQAIYEHAVARAGLERAMGCR